MNNADIELWRTQKQKAEHPSVMKRSHYCFCEACRQYKPKDRRKVMKGWRCLDCRMPNK